MVIIIIIHIRRMDEPSSFKRKMIPGPQLLGAPTTHYLGSAAPVRP